MRALRLLPGLVLLATLSARAHEPGDTPPIGRVDIVSGAELQFCTGALVAPDLVLTAAHCVIDPRTRSLAEPRKVTFRFRHLAPSRTRPRAVSAILTAPGLDPARWLDNPGGATAQPLGAFQDDIALLRLAEPIAGAVPAALAADSAYRGPVSFQGYAGAFGDRIEDYHGCEAIPLSAGAIGLSCRMIPGTSGAPILAPGDTGGEIIAVASVYVEFSTWMRSFAPRVTRARIDEILDRR